MDQPGENMDFEEWAEAYALDDEPCTRHSRRYDCKVAWEAAIAAEREACAKHFDDSDYMIYRSEAAAAIRARSNDKGKPYNA